MSLRVGRREVLAGSLASVVAPGRSLGAAGEEPPGARPATALYTQARAALAAGREIVTGRVKLEIPRLAENGNSVTLRVTVVCPMTDTDYVKTIYLLSEQNPVALIARFFLTPRAGRADVSTSIRLATTQNIHAIAEMNSGALFEAQAESVVLLAACLDGG